jgi:hypothetical protein
MERVMTLSQVSAKIDLRLNKGASGDYDNLWSYQKEEAFNKAVLAWVRRQKHGKNITQEGDEESDIRVDDLQVLLKIETLATKNKGLFSQTERLPTDYLYYKRLTPIVSKGACENIQLKSHLREEANVDDLINLPSFEFEETFHTIISNKANIYHNKNFDVNKALLTYYRLPKQYSFKKLSTVVEFKDDVCEQIVDNACMLLASDTESFNQKQLADEREKTND